MIWNTDIHRIIWFALSILLLPIGLAACDGAALECTDEIGCIQIESDEPIRIATMLASSGIASALGEATRGGIEIAIDDRGGTLLDHPLDTIGEDSLCSAEGGEAAAKSIVADANIVGIIGTNCSDSARAALPILSEAGLSLISPSSTAPDLTDKDQSWQPGFYRTAHNALFQGRVAAIYAYNELGARSAATIHDGTPYTEGIQAAFADTFVELGGMVTFQGAVQVGDTDMGSILTAVSATPTDILYFPIFEPEGNFIVTQSAEIAALQDTVLFAADGLLTNDFAVNTGPAAVGVYLSGSFLSGDAYQALLDKWEAKFGGVPPNEFYAHAYDATNILLDAIEEVAQVGDDGSLLIGRQALRVALTATAGFDGVTGRISCSETGDCASSESLGIYQISENEVSGGNWPPTVVFLP